MAVIIEIGGVPYELVRVDEDSVPILQLYNATGTGHIGLKAPAVADETIKVFTLPEDFGSSGLGGILTSDDNGVLDVVPPGAFLAQLAGGATLSDVISKVNAILTQLAASKITETLNVTITPEPATFMAETVNPQTIIPTPASLGMETI